MFPLNKALNDLYIGSYSHNLVQWRMKGYIYYVNLRKMFNCQLCLLQIHKWKTKINFKHAFKVSCFYCTLNLIVSWFIQWFSFPGLRLRWNINPISVLTTQQMSKTKWIFRTPLFSQVKWFRFIVNLFWISLYLDIINWYQ